MPQALILSHSLFPTFSLVVGGMISRLKIFVSNAVCETLHLIALSVVSVNRKSRAWDFNHWLLYWTISLDDMCQCTCIENTQSLCTHCGLNIHIRTTINLKAITHSPSASTVFLQDNFTDMTWDDTCAHTSTWSYPS